ncbi:Uncharacterised protein [Klebsiella quasipneumoniae]|nr:Uncharacterised protein [Klebsiella quasipneumoniae]
MTQIISAIFVQPAYDKKNRTLNRGRDDNWTITGAFISECVIKLGLICIKTTIKKLHSSILRSGQITLHHRFIGFIIKSEMFHGSFSVDYRHNL